MAGITTTSGVSRGTGETLWTGITENGGVTDVGISGGGGGSVNLDFSHAANSQYVYYLLDDWIM